MKLEERERGLLKLVEDYRERECRRILGAAREKAAETLRETYRKERARLHERVLVERGRAAGRVQAAGAQRATRERRNSDRASAGLLEVAWPQLRAKLIACWRDPRDRRRWVSKYLGQALSSLPKGPWTVRHAPEWGTCEREELAGELLERLDARPRFRSDGGLGAGLIIECEGAVLDASLDGLLRDRGRLEARLLALLREGAGP